MKWNEDKAWSDRFIPEIQAALGQALFSVAPWEEDARHNTDLVLVCSGAIRVACRIRRAQYISHARVDFTLRCSRPSGNGTEVGKLLDGWGDYFFYGCATEDERRLAMWTLGDLGVLRSWWRYRKEVGRTPPGELRRNHDGSSDFLVIRWDSVPGFVVASSDTAVRVRA